MLQDAFLFVTFIVIGAIVLVVGLITLIIFRFRYKTASSNEALIVTGPNLGDPEKEKNVFQDDNGR
ncbi:hypothetical protein [Oceanobacillus limi]|uniref:hypothetical protein n=1 Tax=Oceanobacillus limi TaxID=930131 RepID=UPI003CC7B069